MHAESAMSALGWLRPRKLHVAVVVVALLIAAVLTAIFAPQRAAAAGSPCGANINPVACENSQTAGVTPDTVWDDFTGAGDSTIQGFATDISMNAGNPIKFKIDTTLSYTIDIYRLGYYGGNGARLWQGNLAHSTPVRQPNCLTDPSTLLYDCGNWSVSATWNVPSNAVSGVYLAKLTTTNDDTSDITFIVRNDASTSDIIYQTSDETWEAYNTYGGSDFYQGTDQLTNSQARAFKISYNRPFATRGWSAGRDFLFSNEYPTIRFLERNGYDVSYMAGVDADRFGSLIKNHKVYMSVGHDEYWSQQQRLNVEAARDAGVNLMFLSGNEVYWHTRFEPSIDGSNTAYRTLVCYKQTWDNAQIDPTGESTATWRDPRFANPPGGANPENGLTGTMYKSNFTDLAITVTSAQGKMRLWRNAGLSSIPSGSSVALAPHTVGYESDEDLDNGFRPAGLVDLSTTTGSTPQYLTDFGNTVVPGTTTHHLTLYRASSGALVFGAGTIQWGWGLDQEHDGDNSNPPDPRMQQATINMLADMHALPTTLMSGMVMPTPSTDTQAPTVTINSPAANATLANGTNLTVSGTATDNGGGQVAGVEVSIDGGNTWHPATGTTSWSYTGNLPGFGSSAAIRVRAADDSANMSTPVTRTVTVNCPCSLFGNTAPSTPDSGDVSGVELGVRFTADTDGYVTGVRFYKSSANTGTHTGSLWTSSGQILVTGTFTGETSSGWQTLVFSSPVAVTANTTYVVGYWAPTGHYSADLDFFYYKTLDASPLHAPTTTPDGSSVNGVFSTQQSFPSSTFHATNYYVDALFSPSATVAPSVVSQTPSPGASSIPTSVAPTATFSKPMNPSSISFTLKDPSNNTVPATTTYDSASKTAKLTPNASLADGTLYTATVDGADTNGNNLPAPVTWNFRTAYAGQVGGACPCSIFTDSTVPSNPNDTDTDSVELGIKFTADTDGVVTGARFYKGPLNTGLHTGSLWSATGQQLATATFTNETTSGWQTVTFANPVPVTAGTTYIASYHAPIGRYATTVGAYTPAGVDNFPLHVPTHGAVYTYSTGFPNNASDVDYGVDVVFNVPASVVPTMTASDPSDGDTNIPTNSTISATFNTSILGGTTTMTVQPAGGSAISGTAALDPIHQVLTFTPSAALTSGAVYTVTITGARSLAGTLQAAPITWSFTTGGSGVCPCRLFASNAKPAQVDSGDPSPVTLGVKVVPSVDGYISAIRFYKSSANTGPHTGSVWSSTGTRLGSVTFTNETTSGWQSATLAQPVSVTAGSTYEISYYVPSGHYSASAHYFDSDYTNGPLTVPGDGLDGLYVYGSDAFPTSVFANTNYWVDAVFQTGTAPDNTPPSVTGQTPIDNASSVPASVSPTATFSEAMNNSSITFTLKDASNNAVAGAVAYDSASKAVTFAPNSPLARGVKYTASVSGTDTIGNAMAAPSTWSFTTQQLSPTPGVCPCSVWDDTATPATITANDPGSIELGVKFTADADGTVRGVRFYKGPQNIGTHTGTLWSSGGAQLATATFANESSTGWQTVSFGSPVAITAGTTYLVSYHTSTGYYSVTSGAFATSGVDSPPLHVPAHAGVYLYGSGFPTSSSDANYGVDLVYGQGGGSAQADTTPPVISAVSALPSGTSATVTWTTDEAGSSRVDYGTSASALTSNATSAGTGTSHTVNLTGLSSGTQYYYRVTSADAAGNSATSPATSSAPTTFTTADITPPVVSAVAATGSGTSATVTWTTDEPATSRVDYGTSSSALSLNATTAGLSTSHSVTLSGLTPNTRYYYRVASADAAGNSTASPPTTSAPASYAPTTTPLSDATSANFSAGTTSSTYVASNGAGEVVLTPTSVAEFSGTTLPTGWTSTATVTGGTSTVSGGTVTVSGANLQTTATYSNGKAIETLARLGQNQSIGWVTNSNANVKMSFSVNASNQLIASVNDGLLNNASGVAVAAWTPTTAHKLRIEWTSSAATFYVDDVQKYTHAFTSAYGGTYRPRLSDSVTTDSGLVVDWLRLAPYAASGTFTSRILNAQAPVIWDGLSWNATVPTGNTLTVRVRAGNTPTPDGTWSAFATIPTSGGAISRTSRYLQYQITLTSTGSRFTSPQVRSVTAAFHV